ncbi:MAG TPA: VOC family protein [Bacteroidia bacterium]|jgi:catechol 2,3-dioxygenase-like lactoylglutathione lyase family enzyme
MKEIEFILYVKDQAKSTLFYTKLLGNQPVLDVPGMTEFLLSDNVKLGLMPESGIVKILGRKTPEPATGSGIPRCELYLKISDIKKYRDNAVEAGALIISEIEAREWGDLVCYFADPDGHIIAFAETMP